MTIEEIRAAWLRWMHRNDIEADLATVETMALGKIDGRLMGTFSAPPPETAPRLWLHAGLVYLHELAQDDEGLPREEDLFERAAVDWHFRQSFEAIPLPTLVPPSPSPDTWDRGAPVSWSQRNGT